MGTSGSETPVDDRFPRDRLTFLSSSLLMEAKRLANERGAHLDDLATSKFFCGYLLGFPGYVDEVDQLYGAAIRRLLFLTSFGESVGEAIHKRAMAHLTLSDQQTLAGASCGESDGELYFQLLEKGRSASGYTENLEAAFELDVVNPDDQI